MTSILISIKKMLGIDEEYTHFDDSVMIHINSVLLVLNQIGVGPPEGFLISDATSEWVDFIEEGLKLEFVKTYVYLKVKLLFDPPASSAVVEAINKQIAEYEWRILVQVS